MVSRVRNMLGSIHLIELITLLYFTSLYYRLLLINWILSPLKDKISCLNYFCRQAAGNGATGYGRSDNLSQQTSLAGHSPLPRVDSDHNSLYTEKRERSIGSDKERVNLRAVNKYVL